MEKNFGIYGFNLVIESDDFDLDQLKANLDFAFFKTENCNKPHLTISLRKFMAPSASKGLYLGTTRMCEMRQLGLRKRLLIYREGAGTLAEVVDATGTLRQTEIHAVNLEIIDDILYFLINSTAGEYLDRHGLMRVHAGAFTLNHKTSVVYGPPGVGKSTLVLNLLNTTGVRVFSDEITIFDLRTRKLLPYPIRLAAPVETSTEPGSLKFNYFFKAKKMFELKPDRRAEPAAPTQFFCLTEKDSEVSRLKLGSALMLGLGLIQMREFFVRFDNLWSLAFILVNRLRLCAWILQLKIYSFKKGRDFSSLL